MGISIRLIGPIAVCLAFCSVVLQQRESRAGIFDLTNAVIPSGTTPNGTSWAALASGTTAGPFVFTSGSGAAAVGTTFPAGTYPFAPTTDMAQLGAGFYTLTAGTSASLASSGSGFFDVPWSFGVVAPAVNAPSLVYSAAAGTGFRAVTTGLSAGFTADYLEFGSGVGMFDYTVKGTPGRGVGAAWSCAQVPRTSIRSSRLTTPS